VTCVCVCVCVTCALKRLFVGGQVHGEDVDVAGELRAACRMCVVLEYLSLVLEYLRLVVKYVELRLCSHIATVVLAYSYSCARICVRLCSHIATVVLAYR
jgi:hypothetical protein